MLRDFNISGKINLIDVPALLHTLHFWRVRNNILNQILSASLTGIIFSPIIG
jgi:hypothetical protein